MTRPLPLISKNGSPLPKTLYAIFTSPTLTFFAGIFCTSNELVWLYAKGIVIIPNDPVIMSIIEKMPTVMLCLSFSLL